MRIIPKKPLEHGGYSQIQTWSAPNIPTTHAIVPDDMDMSVFYEYDGFVTLTIVGDTVTAYTANVEAWEAWKASLPDPVDPEPTEEEDTASMLIDHEFRLTMLELGLSE